MNLYLPVLVNRTEFLENQAIIFEHFLDTGHKVLPSQFEIISSANKNNIYMFFLESIFIHQLKPSLNCTLYFNPLGISN